MHTIKVIAGGFALLVLCLIVGRVTGGGSGATVTAMQVFIPLWLVGAGINIWIGVTRAGYSVAEEGSDFRDGVFGAASRGRGRLVVGS